jgi:hypothetical protein
MNVDDIIWRLAALGSLPYQERYVLGGTRDEYAVDTELLEDVDGLQYLLNNPENRQLVNDDQMAALQKLFDLIDTRSGEALARKTREESAALIRESEAWIELRKHSAEALALFGVSVNELSAEDVASLAD